MEVITVGEGYEDGLNWTCTCPDCKSVLKVRLDDIKRNTDWTGDFTSWYYDCPVCFSQPDLPKSQWSKITRLKGN